MGEAPVISDLFAQFGSVSRIKLLILGNLPASSEALNRRLRSLNIEHVSLADLLSQEISRRTSVGSRADRAVRNGQAVPDELVVPLMRRWFWTRKPDAGFTLSGFPATLLQAKVFDEWLEARDEGLDAVLPAAGADAGVADHYRTLGLLVRPDSLAAA